MFFRRFTNYGDLELFLAGLELPDLIPVFQEQQINLQTLLRMREADLERVRQAGSHCNWITTNFKYEYINNCCRLFLNF